MGEEGVVAELRVGVKGEVVGSQRDVRVEEKLQTGCERLVDRADARAPEEAVVDQQEVRLFFCCALEEIGVCRHARRELGYIGRAGDL